jgi:uncharacterized cupredoxin-like copper-binding protein
MRRKALFAAVIVAALGFSACGNDQTPTVSRPPAANKLGVDLSEYKFLLSGSLKSGAGALNFRNSGKELHFAAVSRLDAGKTQADVAKIYTDPKALESGRPPSWIHDLKGGLSILSPGESFDVAFDFDKPGTYLFSCFLPAPNGTPHAALGMFQTFEVTGTSTARAPRPTVTATLAPKRVQVPDVSQGATTFSVKNNSTELANFNVVRLEKGKTFKDLEEWFQKFQGPPPAAFLGGTDEIEAGKSVILTYHLTQGTYTAVSSFGEDEESAPNFTDTFTVT